MRHGNFCDRVLIMVVSDGFGLRLPARACAGQSREAGEKAASPCGTEGDGNAAYTVAGNEFNPRRDAGLAYNSENPKYRLRRRANQRYKLAPTRPEERGVGHRHGTWAGNAVDAAASARDGIAGRDFP